MLKRKRGSQQTLNMRCQRCGRIQFKTIAERECEPRALVEFRNSYRQIETNRRDISDPRANYIIQHVRMHIRREDIGISLSSSEVK